MSHRALVTGSSRGIGAATAVALAAAGHRVVVNYLQDENAACEVVDQIREAGGIAHAVGFDVSDARAVERALQQLDVRKDPIDILVNNAGVIQDTVLAGMRPAQWRTVVATSLDGFYNVTQPLMVPMIRLRWGRIINIVSNSGLSGNRGQVNYSAAKAGLVGATKALAKEVAGRGITVNAVCPGLIDTDMLRSAEVEPLLTRVALGRVGTPEEVARAICFLASDRASYITGHVLRVDGGFA